MAESTQERMQRLYQDGPDYERALLEIEHRIRELEKYAESAKVDVTAEVAALNRQHARRIQVIFENLTPWQRIQLARHPRRPRHCAQRFLGLPDDLDHVFILKP